MTSNNNDFVNGIIVFLVLFLVLAFPFLVTAEETRDATPTFACEGYYPFVEGFKWKYRFNVKRGDKSKTSYTLTVENRSNGQLSGDPTLGQDINLKNTENNGEVLANYPRGILAREERLVEIDPGDTPNPAELKTLLPCPPGAEKNWSNKDKIKFGFLEEKSPLEMELDYRIERGDSEISIPAGIYEETIKVVVTGRKNVKFNQSEFQVVFEETSWYVHETGLVKESLVKKALEKSGDGFANEVFKVKKDLVLEEFERPT